MRKVGNSNWKSGRGYTQGKLRRPLKAIRLKLEVIISVYYLAIIR
jgi:hypothetical protein